MGKEEIECIHYVLCLTAKVGVVIFSQSNILVIGEGANHRSLLAGR